MAALKTCFALRPITLRRSFDHHRALLAAERNARCQILSCSSAQQPQMQSCRFISSTTPVKGSMMKKYEAYLGDNYPKVYKVHRLLVDGSKTCFRDLVAWWYISRDLYRKKRTLGDLNEKEMTVYIQTREDLGKLVPLAFVAALPTALFVIGSAMVFFPRFFVTRHFWTEDQRKQFWSIKIASAAKKHFPPLAELLRNANNPNVNTASLLKVPPLEECSFIRLYHLSMIHGALPIWNVDRLSSRAQSLQHLDALMAANLDGIKNLRGNDLHLQLYLRKICFDDLTTEEKMRESLLEWIALSPVLKSESSYLHLPLLVNNSRKMSDSKEIEKNASAKGE